MTNGANTLGDLVDHFREFVILAFIEFMKLHEAGTFHTPVIVTGLVVEHMLVCEQFVDSGLRKLISMER